MKGIVIQAGGGNVADIAPYTARINSIKVAIVPPTKAISAIAFDIKTPYYNATAPKSVEGTGWTGAVTWTPPIPANGKFEKSTVYFAAIALSPKTDYYILPLSSSDFTVKDSENNLLSGTYDPVSRTYITPKFTATGTDPLALPAFTLSTNAKFQALAIDADPFAATSLPEAGVLVGSGNATASIVKVGTGEDAKNAIKMASNSGSNGKYVGVDISDAYFDFQAGDRIKVVVQLGGLNTTSTSNVNVLLKASPNGWDPIGATYDIDLSSATPGSDEYNALITAALNKDITFERTLTADNVSKIKATPAYFRICLNNVDDGEGNIIIVKEISVTSDDRVAP